MKPEMGGAEADKILIGQVFPRFMLDPEITRVEIFTMKHGGKMKISPVLLVLPSTGEPYWVAVV